MLTEGCRQSSFNDRILGASNRRPRPMLEGRIFLALTSSCFSLSLFELFSKPWGCFLFFPFFLSLPLIQSYALFLHRQERPFHAVIPVT